MLDALTFEQVACLLTYNGEGGEFHWKVDRSSGTLTYQVWPEGELDHINGIRADNRIANLRVATKSGNAANRKAKRSDMPKGVRALPSGNFAATIEKNGKGTYIGTFSSKEEAHAAYYTEAKRLHGEFARPA